MEDDRGHGPARRVRRSFRIAAAAAVTVLVSWAYPRSDTAPAPVIDQETRPSFPVGPPEAWNAASMSEPAVCYIIGDATTPAATPDPPPDVAGASCRHGSGHDPHAGW